MRRPARRIEAYGLAAFGFISMLVAGAVMGRVLVWVLTLAAAVGLAILGAGCLLTTPRSASGAIDDTEPAEDDLAA